MLGGRGRLFFDDRSRFVCRFEGFRCIRNIVQFVVQRRIHDHHTERVFRLDRKLLCLAVLDVCGRVFRRCRNIICRYLAGVVDEARTAGGVWRHEAAEVNGSARVERSVVEAGARVDAGATVEGSLLLPGASIGAGSRIVASIVGPGVEVPAAVEIDGVLLTARDPSAPPVATPL